MLKTRRLHLAPLTADQLRLYLEQPAQLEQELGVPVSRAVVTERVQRAIRMKLARMAGAADAQLAWYTYWLLVVVAEPFGAGLAGFKGPPDAQGEVEIGYGIDPRCQRQGYMTEAVRALIDWAFADPACQAVVARDTQKWNTASLRVLARVGMTAYQETDQALWLRVQRGGLIHPDGNPG